MSPAMWLAEGVTCDFLPMFTLAILVLRTGPWIFIISLRFMFQLGFPCLFSFQRCERAVSLAKIKAKAFSAVAQVCPLFSKFFPTWHLSFHLRNHMLRWKVSASSASRPPPDQRATTGVLLQRCVPCPRLPSGSLLFVSPWHRNQGFY